MKKILSPLLALTLVLSVFSCSGESKYKEYIEKLNEKLPQGNDNIRLDKMVVEDGVFKCYYTILADMPPPAEDEWVKVKEMLVYRVKSESEFKVFRDDELDFYFVYLKPDGSKIWETTVAPSDYK